ncbi:effector-associated constant component EACC1 [Lysobacter solisilvae (ex Woo and Kim 2020)]|uniref:Uncharacterized protein n=1 Tax=Agrilutibacter terrestris TaxID=2865112 RepID=A0A7H0FVZ0_9GAMM|nr:hypothetical protein [Lysobacter terrestris]QNP40206.1 hypothetical protein H8B22_12015 [Lysobacter terrestris]
MTTLQAHVFRNSFGPFVKLLNEHNVRYEMRETRAGVPMASAGIVEIVQAVGAASMWGGLAAVLVAYIKSRSGRKVIITTKDNTVVHAEGLTASELERVLDKASSFSVIDTEKTETEGAAGKPGGA